MKSCFLALGFLLCLADQTLRAQGPPEDPRAGQLVDCGPEKVAIFRDTTSKDGRYALGWTIRPAGKKDPVDWSIYKPDDRGALLDKYLPAVDETDQKKQDYLLVDGVLDLNDKKFTPLPSKDPFFPGRNHWGIGAAWSDGHQGTRYALAAIDARFDTAELWLLTMDARGTRVQGLIQEADKAVADRMRKRDPKDYKDYATTYELEPEDTMDGHKTPSSEFQKDSVTIHFSTGIPKSEVNNDAGKITFALPKGAVLGVTFDKK